MIIIRWRRRFTSISERALKNNNASINLYPTMTVLVAIYFYFQVYIKYIEYNMSNDDYYQI